MLLSVYLDLFSLDIMLWQFTEKACIVTNTKGSDYESVSPWLKVWAGREVSSAEDLEGGRGEICQSFLRGSICGLWDDIKCQFIPVVTGGSFQITFFFFKAEKHTHGVAADSESLITVLILNRHEIYRLKPWFLTNKHYEYLECIRKYFYDEVLRFTPCNGFYGWLK